MSDPVDFPGDFTDEEPTLLMGIKEGAVPAKARAVVGATGRASMAATNKIEGRGAIDAPAINAPQTFEGGQRGNITVLNVEASTIPIDFADGNNFVATLDGNKTLGYPDNRVPGQSGIIEIRQDATGNRNLGYAWQWQTEDGSRADLAIATGANEKTLLSYYVDSNSDVVLGLAEKNYQTSPE